MQKKTHDSTTSLSLNKCIHSGSKNPIVHSSKSLTKPCDHLLVYLYQSLEKLNHTYTAYMSVPFML